MKRTLFVTLLFCTLAGGAQEQTPLPVPFRLTADGHACSGHLTVKSKSVVWKSAFSTCTSASWAVQHQDDAWILTLTPTPEAKACSIRIIRMHPMAPVKPDSLWEVSGYHSTIDFKEHAKTPVLDCVMQ